jgi:predicted DsbA family dithiol-disulfide isomerase
MLRVRLHSRRPSRSTNFCEIGTVNISDMNPASVECIAEGMAPSLTIDFFYDFVCPWCLIGKRHLGAALSRLAELRPDVRVRLQWRSQQLLPDIPVGGVPYDVFYVARLGSPEAVTRRRAQVAQAAGLADLKLAFERIEVMPNTAAAHGLLAWVAEQGSEIQQAALVESLFMAYFMEGEDIGDPAVLARRALECGVEREGLRQYLAASGASNDGIFRSPHAGFAVSGVPFLVFNGTYALSGAYPADALVEAMLPLIQA